jgi:hypothetical protein
MVDDDEDARDADADADAFAGVVVLRNRAEIDAIAVERRWQLTIPD